MRCSPRVAMTVDVTVSTHRSAVARILAISISRPCLTPGVHHATTIIAVDVIGDHLRHSAPVAGREIASKRSSTRLAAFFNRAAGRLSSSKRASAASRSASSNISLRASRSPSTVRCHPTPLSFEALLVVPFALWVMTLPVAQPMHCFDVTCCRARCPTRNGCMRAGHRARMMSLGGGYSPSPASSGSSRRLIAAWSPAMTDQSARTRPLHRRGSGLRVPRRRRRCRRCRTPARRDPLIGVDLADVEDLGD